MKKNFMKAGKKTLSVFLACLMLMTCWVFVEPEHNHAEAVEYNNVAAYNTALLDGISFNTNVTTIWDLNWEYNGDYQDSFEQEAYKNVLYSSSCWDKTATTGSVNLKDSGAATLSWYHGATTFLYDGTTTPRTGVMLNVQTKNGSTNVRTYSSYVTGSGLSMGNTYWYGYDTRANFMYAIQGPNSKNCATTDASRGSNAWTVSSTTYFANYISFTGTMSDTEFYRDITPTWTWVGNQKSQGTGSYYTHTATSVNHIYVINWVPLKKAYNTAATYLAEVRNNPAKYSTRSVAKLAKICKNLVAAHPNNYVNATTNNPSGYSSAASAAVSALNNFSLEERKYDIQAENLFSFADWYYSDSNTATSADVNAGTLSITASASNGELVTAHSSQTTRNQNMYAIPVVGGQNYTVEWTTSCTSTSSSVNSEVFLFFYDEDNQPFTSWASFSPDGKSSGVNSGTVAAPAGAAYMELRFDNNNNNVAETMTFSNIKVYNEARAKEISREDWISGLDFRQVYSYSQAVGSLPTPVRKGYIFDGWQVDSNFDGTPDFNVTSDNPIQLSWPLYSKWTQKTLDIGYDNLFSLSDWYYATKGATSNCGGAMTADLSKGTLAIECPSGSSSADNNYCPWDYDIKVEKNTDYVFVYDADVQTVSGAQNGMQVHLFLNSGTTSTSWAAFPGDGNTNISTSSPYIYTQGESKNNTITFNTGDNDNINVRLGTCGSKGITNTFSNIGLYKKADYDAYVKGYTKVREPFKYGDTNNLMTPSRAGYKFDGWFTAGGTQITSVAGLYESDTVYAHWTKTHTVTFLNADGTTLHTATVITGNALAESQYPTTNPPKDSDNSYSYNFSNWDYVAGTVITSDLTIKPVYTQTAHGNFKYSDTAYKAATCTSNAIVQKYCGNCNYSFGNVVYDGDASAHPEYIAKGHNFEGQPAVQGSDNGSGQHKVRCSRYTTENCGGEKYVDHVWSFTNTTGASCTVNGTNHFSCPCGAKKDETGAIAPSVHLNTEIIGKKSATCTEKGYTGDEVCTACGTTVKYGEDIDAKGHRWIDTEDFLKKEADCVNDAEYWQKCSTCGLSAENDTTGTGTYWTKKDTALGHDWIETESDEFLASAADCENDATYYYDCSRCDASSKDNGGATWVKKGSASGHNFSGEYVPDNNGNHGQKCSNGCGVIGNTVPCSYGAWDTNGTAQHTKKCTECEYTYAENHIWSDWVSDSDDSENPSQHTHICTVCERKETVGCDYESKSFEATCETAGYTTYTCKDCGHGYTVIDVDDPATGHNFNGDYKYNANTDFHNRKCTNPGCNLYGIGIGVDASGVNKWEACSWTYSNDDADGTHTATCACSNSQEEECTGGEATCTKPAECEKCEKEYGETAPHNYSGEIVVLDGDVHAYRCKFCNDQTIYGVGEKENETEECSGGTATCSEKATCDVCGDKHGELDAENHKYGKAVNVAGSEKHVYTCEYNEEHTLEEACTAGSQREVVADCMAGGYMINVCDKCKHEWNSDDVAPAGHKYGAWVSNEDGTHTRICIRPGCKYNETSDGPATETKSCTVANATKVVTAPTCTEEGYTTYTCKDCGYSWIDEDSYTDATGHTYDNKRKAVSADYLRTEQTCTVALTYWYRCDNCNESAETGAEYTADTEKDFYWVSKTASNHTFTKKTATEEYLKSEATCTARAVYYYSCKTCGVTSAGTDGEKTFLYGSVLGHDWAQVEADKYLASAADCVNDATYYKVCSRCGDIGSGIWTKENSKAGHDFDHDNDGEVAEDDDGAYTAATEATCTTAGNVAYYTCEVCGKHYEDLAATTEITKLTVKPLGHNWETVGYLAATCDEKGHSTHMECSVCHEKNSDYEEYAAIGHNFTGDYTYHGNGYHSRLCVNKGCTESGWKGVKYSVTTEGEGEDAVTTIVGAVACTFTSDKYTHVIEDGKHYHSQACVCGNTKKTECTEKEVVVTDPTCIEDGYTTHECAVCGETWKTDIVTALGHDLTAKATSNNDGATHSVKCTKCDYTTEAENCYGGTATCKDKATCEVCGQKYGEKGDHTLAEDGWTSNNDATCTVNGTESQVCSECKETVTRIEEDSALGHDMTAFGYDVSGWTNGDEAVKATIKAPTCAAEGKSISYCTRCDHYITKTVAKLKDSHVWTTDENGEEVWTYVSGDCSTFITYQCVCSQCGKVKTKQEVVDHEWTTVITKVEATCLKEGYKTVKCGNCGAQKNEILPATGHNWDAYGWSTYKEATCCEAEVEISTCPVCKTTETRKGDVPATGIHNAENLVKWVAEPATCESDGYIEHYRSECGKYFLSSDKGKTFTQVEWSQIKRGGTGHADTNGDGKCDACKTGLGSTANDSCICHKSSFFMKIIYSILKFFWKIFGINKTCACGVAHY